MYVLRIRFAFASHSLRFAAHLSLTSSGMLLTSELALFLGMIPGSLEAVATSVITISEHSTPDRRYTSYPVGVKGKIGREGITRAPKADHERRVRRRVRRNCLTLGPNIIRPLL